MSLRLDLDAAISIELTITRIQLIRSSFLIGSVDKLFRLASILVGNCNSLFCNMCLQSLNINKKFIKFLDLYKKLNLILLYMSLSDSVTTSQTASSLLPVISQL